MRKKTPVTPCPCGSGLDYARCCEPLHQGLAAATAEALMRSRYSAYVLKLHDYVQATWHASTRPAHVAEAVGEEAARWLGLEVKRHEQQDATHATVEFVARYRVAGRCHSSRRGKGQAALTAAGQAAKLGQPFFAPATAEERVQRWNPRGQKAVVPLS